MHKWDESGYKFCKPFATVKANYGNNAWQGNESQRDFENARGEDRTNIFQIILLIPFLITGDSCRQ